MTQTSVKQAILDSGSELSTWNSFEIEIFVLNWEI